MDILFENTYISDRRMMQEFFRKYSIGPRPVTTVITGVLMLLCLPTLAVGLMLRENVWPLGTVYVMWIAMQFMPNLFAWSGLRNARKQNDGVMPESRVVFTEENIQIFEGGVHLTVEYRKIVKTVRLKHSYAVMTGKRTAVLIRDDCFTKGSFAEFRAFLAQKCPGIQVSE